MEDIFNTLWNIAETIIKNINIVWQWLNTEIAINIPIRIPVVLPDGIEISLGYSPLQLLGVGILVLLGLWVIKNLAPMA